jgi:predicted small lipoprotein YifL
MTTSTGKYLLAIAICSLLTGCGLKGDLYLEEEPEQPETQDAAAENAPAEAGTDAANEANGEDSENGGTAVD